MRLALLLVTSLFATPAFAGPAPPADAVRAEQPPARTCLVLGGGGARGAAHLGVLEVLEREHIPVDCIAGTSMGAIIGGLYAAGYNAAELRAVLDGIDWKDMFRDDPPRAELPMRRKDDELRFVGGIELGFKNGRIAFPRGAVQGQKLQLLLRRLLLSTVGTEDFDQLPIPFRAIATDIAVGERVVFADGDLALALRASMSVPAAFAPLESQGRLLVDGGISDNVPVDVARGMGATRLIVVNVSSQLAPGDKLNSPFAIANQMLTALMKRETDRQLATLDEDDLLLTPELDGLTAADFDRMVEGVAAGRAAAEALLPRLRAFAVSDTGYAAFEARHRQVPFDPPLIEFLDVLQADSRTAGYVQNMLSELVGERFDAPRVERAIGHAFGEGYYERIGYRLERRDGQTGLMVMPTDKSWGPNYLRAGLRLADDFSGNNGYQLTAEANFTGLNDYGGESRNRINLGRITGAHFEYRQPFGRTGEFHVAPYVEHRAFDIPLNLGTGTDLATYRRKSTLAALELGWAPSIQWEFSGTLAWGHDSAHLRVGDADLQDTRSDIAGITLRAVHDSFDNVGFPTRGSRFDLSQETLLEALGSDETAHIIRLRWDRAFSPSARDHVVLGASANLATGGAGLLAAYSPLGGLGNLSGYTESQFFGRQTLLARAIYYRRLTDSSRLFSVPVYLGGTLEAAGMWDRRDEIQLRASDLIAAGSLFLGVETPFGPMFLGYGQAEGGHSSFYLTFGSLLRSDR